MISFVLVASAPINALPISECAPNAAYDPAAKSVIGAHWSLALTLLRRPSVT